jgi:alpha-tubulin suppressor-like RCC1 family protein
VKAKNSLLHVFLLCVTVLQAVSSGAQPVIKIATGDAFHSLFLKSDGSLWAMGLNSHGQLGDGTFNNTNRPEQIVASNVTVIATGVYHSLFLKSDGSLWVMGLNQSGALGDGTSGVGIQTNLPEQIVASNVVAIAAGFEHSLFLKSDGSLWAMGNNEYGQLGDGHSNQGVGNYNTNRPEQIVSSNVTAIAANEYHSFFLMSNGSLWGMGSGLYGQLGDGNFNYVTLPVQIVASNVVAIAAGTGHSLFLKSDGSLWGMGLNQKGELGDGTFNMTNRPEQIVASSVTAIAAGNRESHFLKNDGSLWGMGMNFYGGLGDGTFNMTNRP